MHTIKLARGVVTGADHRRLDRPGQDAAAAAIAPDGQAACVVVCDGCGSTPAAQIGAELGARWIANAVVTALAHGASAADPDLWAGVRRSVVDRIAALVAGLADPVAAIHDLALFTIVAAAVDADAAAVWAIGDGGYALGNRTAQLGPFADNRPPYLAYDLLDDPRAATLVTCSAGGAGVAAVATDGAAPLDLAALADDSRLYAHPDALRRYLVIRARPDEQIDWREQRIVRAPAVLTDDCAIALLRWGPVS